MHKSTYLFILTTLASFVVAGCGSSSTPDTSAKEMARQALLAASDDFTFESPPPTATDDCDVTLTAGADANGDASMINTAVEDASSFDIICLSPGTYAMDNTVTVSAVSNLMVKGIGATPEDVILDFDGQASERGFDVTTPGFWIENMWIKNTSGNGVEVKATSTAAVPNVFRKLKVSWDTGSVTENGAYSVYPTRSEYAIVEFCEVSGASDAGLYVGQVVHGLVRHNKVYANVAGLEVENSEDVEVYDNEVYDNSGGILALQEPGLARLANTKVLIRDNHVYDNNHANFANPTATVANIPPGTGLMAFAGVGIEFRNNLVEDNDSTGVLIVSNVVLQIITGGGLTFPDGYDPYPQQIYINGNTFTNNGTMPDPALLDAIENDLGGPALTTLETVLWDGFTKVGAGDPEICLGTTDVPSFRALIADSNEHECDLTEISITPF